MREDEIRFESIWDHWEITGQDDGDDEEDNS